MAVTISKQFTLPPQHAAPTPPCSVGPCVCYNGSVLAWEAQLKWIVNGISQATLQSENSQFGGLYISHNVNFYNRFWDNDAGECLSTNESFEDLFPVSLNGAADAVDCHGQVGQPFGTPCDRRCLMLTDVQGSAKLVHVEVDDGHGGWRKPNLFTPDGVTIHTSDLDKPWGELRYGRSRGQARNPADPLADYIDLPLIGPSGPAPNPFVNPRKLKFTPAYPRVSYHYGYAASVLHCGAAVVPQPGQQRPMIRQGGAADDIPNGGNIGRLKDLFKKQKFPSLKQDTEGGTDSGGRRYLVSARAIDGMSTTALATHFEAMAGRLVRMPISGGLNSLPMGDPRLPRSD